jgi:3-isopropylmalate/(R)-2-methylmalate dehydratase small subunit
VKKENDLLFSGNVYKIGDDIDTDGIIPAKYLNITDPRLLAQHCMEEIDPAFLKKIKEGDILVAGKNFGCGSSREQAPLALKGCGIACIIAPSFSRLFFRNAINVGLPIIEFSEAEVFAAGDRLKIDYIKGEIVHIKTGGRFETQQLPPFMQNLFKVGGLLPYIKERAIEKQRLNEKI